MKPKPILTVGLLVFVAASVAFLAARELWPRRQGAGTDPGIPSTGHRVVAFYFYTNVRCPTCHKIESYTAEAVQARFADAAKAGQVLWRPINTDESGNGHFLKDYELATKAVIVADFREGRQVRWKNLDRIWDLVSDKDAFQSYIAEEVAAYVKGP